MKTLFIFLLLTGSVLSSSSLAGPPDEVSFSGPPSSPISSAVGIPAGRALYLTSGTAPSVADESAPAGSPARFGDTKTQGISVMHQIETRLKEAGLGLKDVVYLRVYVAADKTKDGKVDYPGWFEAYGQFFGTAENPVKPARSTVGVAGLVNPDWLIEIEAVAVYPAVSATKPPASVASDTPTAAPDK